MIVETVTVGSLGTNCYMLSKDKDARDVVLVDPGAEGYIIKQRVGERHVAAVLLTHGHFDHTGALACFKDAPIYIHPKDAPMLKDARLSAGDLMEDTDQRPKATDFYDDGDVLDIAGLKMEVLSTPGHTMGSVCLKSGDQMLTGDTLFKGDYGRTDLPGGSETMMRATLRRLFALHGTHCYPGHGEETDIP